MRVLVCGSRHWVDRETIWRELDRLDGAHEDPMGMGSNISVIIHGGCRGADSIAGEWAVTNWKSQQVYPADWATHGRAAGPIRNQQMIKLGRPDLVLAFHENIEESKGTKDLVARARAAGIEVRIITGREEG